MVEASRIERLAALAERHRLAIVDALTLGDLAPTELGERVGLASNLLAHHLGTLEAAGIVRRRRSDGDGRRTYLTLAWDDAVVAAVAAEPHVRAGRRVVFVCTGNSARSQMAASLLDALGLPAASAGSHPADEVNPLAIAELVSHGLVPLAETPRDVGDVITPDDLVVAVCDRAYEEIGHDRVGVHWSIPSPTDGDPAAFAETFASLRPRVERLADALRG